MHGIRFPWLDGRIDRGLAWAIAGFVLYAVGYVAALLPITVLERFLLPSIGFVPEVGTVGWGLFLGTYPIAWGVIVLAPAAWIGLRLVPGLRPGRPSALVVATVGLALAACTDFALHEFVRARFGEFMVRGAGFAYFAGPVIVAVSTAGWAALAAPRSMRRPLVVEVLLAAVAFAIVVLPGTTGFEDGISATGWLMIAALGLDAVFAIGVVVAALLDRRG